MREKRKQTIIDFKDYISYIEGIKDDCEEAYHLASYKNVLTRDDVNKILMALKRAKEIRI